MATIREDVVSISFEVENNPFAELTAQMDELKQSVTGGVNDANNELKKLANGAEIRFSASQLVDIYNGDNADIAVVVDPDTNNKVIKFYIIGTHIDIYISETVRQVRHIYINHIH